MQDLFYRLTVLPTQDDSSVICWTGQSGRITTYRDLLKYIWMIDKGVKLIY